MKARKLAVGLATAALMIGATLLGAPGASATSASGITTGSWTADHKSATTTCDPDSNSKGRGTVVLGGYSATMNAYSAQNQTLSISISLNVAQTTHSHSCSWILGNLLV